MERYAIIRRTNRDNVAAYLPGNYEVWRDNGTLVVIRGHDNAGWTMDDYVLPRLASGLIFGQEVDRDTASVQVEVMDEESYNADAIERYELRGITPPEY